MFGRESKKLYSRIQDKHAKIIELDQVEGKNTIEVLSLNFYPHSELKNFKVEMEYPTTFYYEATWRECKSTSKNVKKNSCFIFASFLDTSSAFYDDQCFYQSFEKYSNLKIVRSTSQESLRIFKQNNCVDIIVWKRI